VDAFIPEQLAEVEDDRLVGCEELDEPLGVALVREPLIRVPGVWRITFALQEQTFHRLVPGLEAELLDGNARRHLVHAVDVTNDVFQHFADVRRADEHGARRGERLTPPR
jgi:hypothetical protein